MPTRFLTLQKYASLFFTLEEEIAFMPGLCVIPREVKGSIVKELFKMRKRQSKRDEQSLMLKIEYLKTKSLRYSHLALEKIFSF